MGVSPLARTDNAWGEWGLARMAVYVSYALHARCSRTSVATMRDERPHQTCAEKRESRWFRDRPLAQPVITKCVHNGEITRRGRQLMVAARPPRPRLIVS